MQYQSNVSAAPEHGLVGGLASTVEPSTNDAVQLNAEATSTRQILGPAAASAPGGLGAMLSHEAESYSFWDVVTYWAQEQLVHEDLAARALARGVVQDGLRLQSVDSRCGISNFELPGEPPVAYVAKTGEAPIFIRRAALSHLLAVVQRAAVPDRVVLQDELVAKQDFLAWLDERHFPPPHFLFAAHPSAPVVTAPSRALHAC